MKWNKKGEVDDLLQDALIYLILTVLFAAVLFMFINQQKNGAGYWEDFYAKEIAGVINLANPGDEVTLDIQKASVIARKNGFLDLTKVVKIDNDAHEVVVQMGISRATRFSYFNDVFIDKQETRLGVPGNVFYFRVLAKNASIINGNLEDIKK